MLLTHPCRFFLQNYTITETEISLVKLAEKITLLFGRQERNTYVKRAQRKSKTAFVVNVLNKTWNVI